MGEIFKRAEEPIEEEKTRKPASDKTHGSLLCAELSAVHWSYNGLNTLNGELSLRASGSATLSPSMPNNTNTEKCSALLKEKYLQTASNKTLGAYGALVVKAYVSVAYKHTTS